MEERRKVYGWLVRDKNTAVGCSYKMGMAGYGVYQTVEIRFDLFSTKSLSRVERVERVDIWEKFAF